MAMRFFHVRSVYGFTSRQSRLAMGHGKMVHGWKQGPYDDRDPSAPGKPLEIWRSGRWVPEVSYPGELVVREQVKRNLEGVPGIAFLPVRWGKLADLPHYPPGDFSFLRDPIYIRAVGKHEERLDELHYNLPDAPVLHEGFPTCYEVLIPSRSAVDSSYQPHLLTITRPESSGGPVRVKLSADLLCDYPIIHDMGLIFSEAVWPLIDPHIDRDFFDVVEGEA
jgi:hypothetical protein